MSTNQLASFYYKYESPLGELLLVQRNGKLAGIYFENHKPSPKLPANLVENPTVFNTTIKSLENYFSTGSNASIPEFELIGTEFQKAVWLSLLNIKPGKTITYKQIAELISKPNASRAVGAAVGRNPISILLPCHRVVGSNGLTGYAGGIERKRWLLEHEQKQVQLALPV